MFNSSPCFALKKAKRSGLKVYFKIKQKTVLYAGKYFGAKELFAYRSEVEVMKIIMLGAPGAGKGTQAKKIAEKYHADFLTLQDTIILKAEKAGYESVTTDGIHLTEYGNEIIAGAWLQLFEKIKDGD